MLNLITQAVYQKSLQLLTGEFLVGSIEDILFTNESIKAKIVLNNPEIILPKPAFARVVTNSFLGGDVQVALETSDKTIPKNIAKPISEKCDTKLIICQGDTITGKQLSSLSNITCLLYTSDAADEE